MKTKKSLMNGLYLVVAAGLFLTSCKKKEQDDSDTAASRDNAFAEATYNDVANIADEAGQNGSVSNYKMAPDEASLLSCATVTLKKLNSSDQDTIIIDFGSTNCTGNDGRQRRGKVIVYYLGKYKKINSAHTITFDNYYVNDNKVDGSKTVTNKGFNGSGYMYWDVSVNGNITLANNGGSLIWTSNRTRTLLGVLGSTMLNSADTSIVWSKSRWGITGSASGSNNGTSYTVNITKQIVFDITCSTNRRHPTEGTFDITPSGKATRTVDFGNGACDDQATVTIKGKTYNVTMK